jgi:hypothetical protein
MTFKTIRFSRSFSPVLNVNYPVTTANMGLDLPAAKDPGHFTFPDGHGLPGEKTLLVLSVNRNTQKFVHL